MAEVTPVDAVVKEVQQVGHDGLGSLGLQQLDQMVVRERHILHQNFAHNADTRLTQRLVDGQRVKVRHDAAADVGIAPLRFGVHERIDADLLPLLMDRLGAALFQLIGAHMIEAAHEEVAVDQRVDRVHDEALGEREALVLLHAVEVDGDDRNVTVARLFQRAADEADVVARAAAAARLRHHEGKVIGVIAARGHRLHKLADHRDGREAGVVVDVLEPHVDGPSVVVLEQHHVVAVLGEHRLENIKVNGAHLGREQRPLLVAHFFCEGRAVISRALRVRVDALLTSDPHGGEQAADADTHRAEVVDLVDLENGVELVAALENFGDLVGGHRVKAAAERVELNELETVAPAHEFRRRVEAGVVYPLVVRAQRALGREVDGQAVLGQHVKAVGGDQLGDAVVDLRIKMVGPPRENDAAASLLPHFFEHPRALGANILLGPLLLGPGKGNRLPRFLLRYSPLLAAEARHAVGDRLLAREGKEGLEILHLAVGGRLHVVLQILGVGHHDGAVEMILRVRRFLMLEEHAGVEDGMHALVDEPLHMAVGELRGIALGLGRNGLHAALVEPAVGERREDHAEAEGLEKCRPEGVVLVHIQHTRDAELTARRSLGRKRRIAEQPLALVGEKVRALFVRVRIARALLAAVAGGVAPPAGEARDRQHTAVGAAAAAQRLRLVLQRFDLRERKHRGLLPMVVAAGDQRRAERAHESRNVGTDCLRAGDPLKRAQHSLVVKGAALHDNVRAKLTRVGELDDLIERVFDDGIGKPRRNIRHARALLLRLLDVGVHEYRAARAEIDRVRREQRFLGKALGAVAERSGKVLDERAAAGRARLVEQHIVHAAVVQLDALHVLPADVQHAVHLRIKEGGGGAVSDGLDLALVEREGRLQQRLAVAGRALAQDVRTLRQLARERGDGALRRLNGTALIVRVVRPQQLAAFADERELCRGRASVHTKEAAARIACQVSLLHHRPRVARAERVVVLL